MAGETITARRVTCRWPNDLQPHWMLRIAAMQLSYAHSRIVRFSQTQCCNAAAEAVPPPATPPGEKTRTHAHAPAALSRDLLSISH